MANIIALNALHMSPSIEQFVLPFDVRTIYSFCNRYKILNKNLTSFFYSNFELQNDINREKIYFNDFPKVVLI